MRSEKSSGMSLIQEGHLRGQPPSSQLYYIWLPSPPGFLFSQWRRHPLQYSCQNLNLHLFFPSKLEAWPNPVNSTSLRLFYHLHLFPLNVKLWVWKRLPRRCYSFALTFASHLSCWWTSAFSALWVSSCDSSPRNPSAFTFVEVSSPSFAPCYVLNIPVSPTLETPSRLGCLSTYSVPHGRWGRGAAYSMPMVCKNPFTLCCSQSAFQKH